MKPVNNVWHCFESPTSQDAWETLNEMFLVHHPSLFEYEAYYNKGISTSFNVAIKIKKAWVDPEFDYGKLFNYKEQKWVSLVNNYLDLNKLDLLRSKVRYYQSKYNQNYNLSYLFDNKHDNGKGCLLSATFSRRYGEDIPLITMVLRSSEITKRLIFDLLLIQRMGEYIYGSEQSFQISLVANQMYCNTETVLMYTTHKSLKKVFREYKNTSLVTEDRERELKAMLKRFQDNPHSFSKFKVFLRSAKCINPKAFNHVYKPLLAKNLKIYDDALDIEYPENCITLSQRRKFLKSLIKK